MIHQIGQELQLQLKSLGVPFTVVDGPERTKTTTWGRERIVIEYDADAADSFGPPMRTHRNPKHLYTAFDACKVTIYAQSTQTGASVFEHRQRVKLARDKVLVGLKLVAAKRGNLFAPGAGKLTVPDDLADTERAAGAAYELKFTFSRGVDTRTWAGAKAAEFTIGPSPAGVPITSSAVIAPEDGDPTNPDALNGDTGF